MASNKLNSLFLISLLLIYLHGFEEIIGGFPSSDSFIIYGGRYFGTTPENFYWIFHTIYWLLLPILFILFHIKRIGLFLMTLFSFVFIFESHHILKAIIINDYYPGVITAIFYPIIGFFFLRQLIKDWKNK
ncbi:TPA: hypothetical protein DD690_04990 [Candidatus Daviesbacteria bacterium]|uniref:HXXEE domain-containing protein n=1 Tax=Candidatus Daviesbacteria bacterium GW2011_GWF2_38_6 TaxID=1618432 RepID=A0A0G0KD63_9BACT|nr:MAG: hypothetical protein US80_C0001G0001 [Candidatus Daviesbacteria bacterium GW2011_GWA2_38_17]KKQ77573.1 MAG: hypothetical protein US99_C0038G0015 [Candidatus Daviesbacteria bacterium GW2011_GWF2_38_6]OGE26254.1 MAG: hypothetical protein A3D02_04285 [Candidatus Daviesbacteria bacterium RIFCSPHIGHO2_02_FULL_39_41]OGE44959.1 MAG: hypothetical protein A3E67_02220 [Candidatus Daviesbacteria bacterium RIFCSPHIGHO2_12_FULL_38_25]OGE68433.1 MAG: hypothetical protein A3H81_05735 [Candidatus Davie